MRRRGFLAGVGAMALLPAPRLSADSAPTLLDLATRLSAQPYRAPQSMLPPPFAGLDYDAYRGIRPIPGRAALLPHGPDFAVDLLPPGLFFPDPVRIDLDTGDGPGEVALSPDLFSFDPRYFGAIPGPRRAPGFPACACATR